MHAGNAPLVAAHQSCSNPFFFVPAYLTSLLSTQRSTKLCLVRRSETIPRHGLRSNQTLYRVQAFVDREGFEPPTPRGTCFTVTCSPPYLAPIRKNRRQTAGDLQGALEI